MHTPTARRWRFIESLACAAAGIGALLIFAYTLAAYATSGL